MRGAILALVLVAGVAQVSAKKINFKCADPINGRNVDCTSLANKKNCNNKKGGCCMWAGGQCKERPCATFGTKACRQAPHCGWNAQASACHERSGCATMVKKECNQRWQYCKWNAKQETCSAFGNAPNKDNTGPDGMGCRDLPQKQCRYFSRTKPKLCVYTEGGKNAPPGSVCMPYAKQVRDCLFGNNQRVGFDGPERIQIKDPEYRCNTNSQGQCKWVPPGDIRNGACVKDVPTPSPVTAKPTKSPTYRNVPCFSLASNNINQCCTAKQTGNPIKTVYTRFVGSYTPPIADPVETRQSPTSTIQFEACTGTGCATDPASTVSGGEMEFTITGIDNTEGETCTNPKLVPNIPAHDCVWCPYQWEYSRCVKYYNCPSGPAGPGSAPGCGILCRRARALLAAKADKIQK